MDIITAVGHLTAVKRYATASYAMAIFEYFTTLDKEVEAFWNRRFSFVTVLWFLNRYTLLFSLFPTLIGFYYPYTHEQCSHFVKFPGAMQIISNIASGVTLSMRVYALFGGAWWIIVVLLPIFIAEIAVESWAVAGGVSVILPDGLTGCILTGKEDGGIKFAAFWVGQLVFPTLIFVMTLIGTLRLRRIVYAKDSILTVLLRDGIMYFLVIFIANTANVITYIIAPEDLKFANAPFTNVITTLMICRLMLNLRQKGGQRQPFTNQSGTMTLTLDISRPTFLGNTGEDFSEDETFVEGIRRDRDTRRGLVVS